jgi:hypothetical protein
LLRRAEITGEYFFPGNVNKLKMKNRGFILLLYLFFVIQASAQVFTNKEVGQKNAGLIDSLKKSEYPYSLPYLGCQG